MANGEGFRHMSVVTDHFAVQVSLGGGITNLLRMARNECQGLVAFVAAVHDGGIEIATFPPNGGEERVGGDSVAQLVRQISSDPEFGHGGPFVRSVVLEGYLEPVTVAVAPLGTGGEQGLLGVVGRDTTAFGERQRKFLEGVALRLSRHLKARGEMDQRRRAGEAEATAPVRPAGDSAPFVSATPDEATAPRSVARAWEAANIAVPPPWAAIDRSGAVPQPAGESGPVVPPVRWSVADQPTEQSGPSWAREPAGDLGVPGAVPWRVGEVVEEATANTATRDLFSWAWEEKDEVTGLAGLGSFFSRAGRMAGPNVPGAKALAMMVVEVRGFDRPEELVAQLLATTLQSQLRASDPLARVGRTVFAVAMALDPGSTLAPAIEQRLAGAVRSALKHGTPQAAVLSAHVLAGPDQQLEADELLRRALRTLRSH